MRIVAFGIHPDDIELGCGGTVVVCRRLGHDVILVDLTRGEASTNGTPDQRAREAIAAAAILGCDTRLNAGLPDAGVMGDSESQQRIVTSIIRSNRPDLVIYSTADDPHPDHIAGAALIERGIELAGDDDYETNGGADVWSETASVVYGVRRQTKPDVVVDITGCVSDKQRAIAAHASQFVRGEGAKPTNINSDGFLDMIVERDRQNGQLIGVDYGEGFSAPDPSGLKGINIFRTSNE